MDCQHGDTIPVLDLTIKEDDIKAGALKVISVIRPSWDQENIVIKVTQYIDKNYNFLNYLVNTFIYKYLLHLFL